MVHIEIYTKDWCSYCAQAKALLNARGLAFEEIERCHEYLARDEIVERELPVIDGHEPRLPDGGEGLKHHRISGPSRYSERGRARADCARCDHHDLMAGPSERGGLCTHARNGGLVDGAINRRDRRRTDLGDDAHRASVLLVIELEIADPDRVAVASARPHQRRIDAEAFEPMAGVVERLEVGEV